MENLEYYKKADLQTLIPVAIRLKDNSINTVMIPKIELWYEAGNFSGHKQSGFKNDKLLIALDNRELNYKSAFYPFI
jgi:hypothetical protein